MESDNPFCVLLLLLQPRIFLVLFTARVLLSHTALFKGVFGRATPHAPVSSLYHCKDHFLPKCRDLHLSLLSFIRILLACSSNLYRSFYMTALSCCVSTVSLSLVRCANLMKVHSIVSETCRSLVKMLNTMSSRIDPCGSQLFNQPPDRGVAP